MKNVIATIALVSFAIVAYAENITSTETRFAEGTCYEKNEYCELTDFRGKIHEYWFGVSIEKPEDSIYENVPFYVGAGGNGIWCSDGLCGNANSEIIGLDPRWPPFAKAFASQQNTQGSSDTQQPVQQASEPPIDVKALVTSRTNLAGQQLYKVEIISLEPEVEISHVTINRNEKCNDNDYIEKSLSGRVRTKFKMGEKKLVTTVCDPVEVSVKTNQGEFMFKFR